MANCCGIRCNRGDSTSRANYVANGSCEKKKKSQSSLEQQQGKTKIKELTKSILSKMSGLGIYQFHKSDTPALHWQHSVMAGTICIGRSADYYDADTDHQSTVGIPRLWT